MATMSSMKFPKNQNIEYSEANINPNYNTYNHKSQHSNQFQGNPNLTSQEKFYSNLYSTNSNPMYFSFKERTGKLKWKEIMKLDIESMIKGNDISPLENFLENLIFSQVDLNDVEIITENTTVKLIKIYQHILEYLLHTQIRLENENKMLENNYTQILNETVQKENVLKDNKVIINTLKKDKREKEMILHTYKCIIEEYKSGVLTNTVNKNNIMASINPKQNLDNKIYYNCNLCEGKKFSTEENLNSHYRRRHASVKKGNSFERTYEKDMDTSDMRHSRKLQIKTLEFQMEDLKNLFQNFMKNNISNDSLSKLAENQKNLENKLGEVKYDKDKMMSVMEDNFKNTLVEIKEFVKNNQMNSSNNFKHEDFDMEKNELITKQKEGIDTIKNNIDNMNQIISEIKKNQNEKMQNVYEQLDNIKITISNEIKDLKVTNINNQSFADSKYNKFRTESIENTNAFSITNVTEANKVSSKNNLTNNIKVLKGNNEKLENENSENEEKSNYNHIEKNRSIKISRENRNNIIFDDTYEKTVSPERKKINKKEEIKQIKDERKNDDVIEKYQPKEKPVVTNNNLIDNQVNLQENVKKIENYEEVSNEKVDISNITKEKTKKLLVDDTKLPKKQDEQEFILDDVSEDVNKNVQNQQGDNNQVTGDTKEDIQFKKKDENTNKSDKNVNNKKVQPDINEKKNINEPEGNLEEMKQKYIEQFKEREKIFNKSIVDFNKINLEKDEGLPVYKKILNGPKGENPPEYIKESLNETVNEHIFNFMQTKDLKMNNITEQKSENLIGLIDNILNYINEQKDIGSDQNAGDDDEEEYKIIFGKYYNEFNKTIFKKISLDEEYNFMLNNISGLNKDNSLINNFRETLNIPKPNKDGIKFINKIEEKNSGLIESKEITEKLKNFNRENSESKENKIINNINPKVNVDDEFNH